MDQQRFQDAVEKFDRASELERQKCVRTSDAMLSVLITG
jgi:hypothetical protein